MLSTLKIKYVKKEDAVKKQEEKDECFLVKGTFKAYKNGRFQGFFYIKEHFQTFSREIAKFLGIIEAQKRAEKKYGQGIKLKPTEIIIQPAPIEKFKKKKLKRREIKSLQKNQKKLF